MSKIEMLLEYRKRTPFISRHEFGGNLLRQSHAKVRRPHSQKHFMHFVLSTSSQISGKLFLIKENRKFLLKKMTHLQKIFAVKMKEVQIENGIIQYVCRCESRKNLAHFNRALSGTIARKMTGVEKGKSRLKTKFFSQRPFSRIIIASKVKYILSKQQTTALALGGYIPNKIQQNYYSSA